MRPVLHNCYLPEWLHRAANGAIGGVAGLGVAIFAVQPFGAPLWALWLGAITGAGCLLLPRTVSLVEGCAGDAGYEELDPLDRERAGYGDGETAD